MRQTKRHTGEHGDQACEDHGQNKDVVVSRSKENLRTHTRKHICGEDTGREVEAAVHLEMATHAYLFVIQRLKPVYEFFRKQARHLMSLMHDTGSPRYDGLMLVERRDLEAGVASIGPSHRLPGQDGIVANPPETRRRAAG